MLFFYDKNNSFLEIPFCRVQENRMENNEKNEIALNTTIRRVVKLSIVVLFSQK